MQVKTTELGVATYLAPDGALVEKILPTLEKSAQAARAKGALNLVIDLRQVPAFDSPGLEFLLDLSDSLRDAGGSLRLAAPNALCAEVLAITRLAQSIPVFEDIESAGRSFL